MEKSWDIIVVGGGPAGLAAAIYCGRALRRTLVLEKKVFGGQIVSADIIENYPGFVDPISPSDLMEHFGKQAERYGVTLENDEVTAIAWDGQNWQVNVYGSTYTARALIFAAGSAHRFLGVPGEEALLGRGVSVCATCDAPFFVNRRVAIIGGGDTALAEALHLAKFASEVTVIHRRDKLRAERILQERAMKNEKLRFLWDSQVLRFNGSQRLESLDIKDRGGRTETHVFDGVFLAIGTVPNTALLRDVVELDENGYVTTDISLTTSAPGLFVAGEVIGGNHRQVAISTGMGVQAALSCEHWLATRE
jgi:thioredoxin reductase (NADPH)